MSHTTSEPIHVTTTTEKGGGAKSAFRFFSWAGEPPKRGVGTSADVPLFRSIEYGSEVELGAAIAGRYPLAIVDGKPLSKRFPVESIEHPKPVLSVKQSKVEEEREAAAEVARGDKPTSAERRAGAKIPAGQKKPAKRETQSEMFGGGSGGESKGKNGKGNGGGKRRK